MASMSPGQLTPNALHGKLGLQGVDPAAIKREINLSPGVYYSDFYLFFFLIEKSNDKHFKAIRLLKYFHTIVTLLLKSVFFRFGIIVIFIG